MLKDLWPGMVEDKELLNSPLVWEGTRYCIDKDVEPVLRTRIVHEMAAAYLEFGLQRGLTKIIGMMPTYIYRSVFEKPGIEMEVLGPVTMIGRHRVRAVAIPVDHAQLANVRATTGIDQAVLTFLPAAREERFAYDQAA
jgi:acyl homoserine lactone synthase